MVWSYKNKYRNISYPETEGEASSAPTKGIAHNVKSIFRSLTVSWYPSDNIAVMLYKEISLKLPITELRIPRYVMMWDSDISW